MKISFGIAKLELNTLFYSPIAWFLSVVFLFQCGLDYTNILQNSVVNQSLGGTYLDYLDFMTNRVFGLPFGLFSDVLSKAYLYLPLLTMGLISREINNGTIKLLYSSPVRISQIVLGKFLAMGVYSLVLTAIIGIYVVTGLFNILHADSGQLLSSLLGIFLLLCTYGAIGLFMSCLTSYQVVAALSTLVVFAILRYVGSVWQNIDFVRDLTYFLSISGRTNHMINGLITSKDVLYFLLIMGMFLGFSIIKLQSGRESVSWIRVAARYAAVLVLTLIVGYISSLPGLIAYYDATATQSQTLTANSQKIVKGLGNEPLQVTSYINLLDQRYWQGKPETRNQDRERWEPFLRFKPNIKFTYVNYYDSVSADQHLFDSNPGKSLKDIAGIYANSFKVNLSDFKAPDEMRRIIDLRPEENRYVMHLAYRGKTTFLRLFNDPGIFPSETETAAALKRLTSKLPKVVFLEGEFERSREKAGDKDYSLLTSRITFRDALVNQGFDMETISLAQQDIPEGIAVLVIADPRAEFSEAAASKIRQYIQQGGNVLIAGEPGKQAVLNPILQPLGVQMEPGMLLQKSADFPADHIWSLISNAGKDLSSRFEKAIADSAAVSMPGAAALTYSRGGPFSIQPLLETDSKRSWLKKKKVTTDSAEVTFSAADGDRKGPFATALALRRTVNGKEQRIVVTGDADFLSNAELSRGGAYNFQFDTPLIGWFTYGQFPIDTNRPASRDNRVTISAEGVSVLRIVFLWVTPGILLAFAAVFLMRRNRK